MSVALSEVLFAALAVISAWELRAASTLNERLVAAIEVQLARCGPEHLAAAPPEVPGSAWRVLFWIFFAVAFGFGGGWAAAGLLGRRGRPAPVGGRS